MVISTFDTHKYVRRLEKVGVPVEQAEVQADVLTEAFRVNLEDFVTKEYMATQFAKQNAVIDTRFSSQQAYMDTRFAELEAKMDSNFTVLRWMTGIVMAALVIPLIQQLLVF